MPDNCRKIAGKHGRNTWRNNLAKQNYDLDDENCGNRVFHDNPGCLDQLAPTESAGMP